MKLAICIILLSFELLDVVAEGETEEDDHRIRRATTDCASRCERLLARSLERIGTTIKKVDLESKTRSSFDLGMTDICWKFMDYVDCANQCEDPGKESRIDDLAEVVNKRCKVVNKENTHNFRCIHKYHGFIEVRCSSYQNEASKLRQSVSYESKEALQETCRFLHYHNMCLMNTVIFYCPTAKKLFNRFTLRDYFLSFITPKNDLDFSDQILDYCQVFDFQKMAKDLYDSTADAKTIGITQSGERGSTEVELIVETTTPKKIFSSDEDLAETPPNFFYSSARIAPTFDPDQNIWTKTPNWTYYATEDDVHPVEIEFVPHPVDIESIFDDLSRPESTEIVEEKSRMNIKTTKKPIKVTKTHEQELGGYVTTAPSKIAQNYTPVGVIRHRPIKGYTTVDPKPREKVPTKSITPQNVSTHVNTTKDKPTTTHGTPRTLFTIDANSILSTIFRIPALFPTAVVDPDPTRITLKNITSDDYVTVTPHDYSNEPIDHPLIEQAKKHEVLSTEEGPGPEAMTEIFDIRITPEYDGGLDDEDIRTTIKAVDRKRIEDRGQEVTVKPEVDNSKAYRILEDRNLPENRLQTVPIEPIQHDSSLPKPQKSDLLKSVPHKSDSSRPIYVIYEMSSTGPTLQPYIRDQRPDVVPILDKKTEISYRTTSIRPDTTLVPYKKVSNPRKPTVQLDTIVNSKEAWDKKEAIKKEEDRSREKVKPVKSEKPPKSLEKYSQKTNTEDTPKTNVLLPPVIPPKQKPTSTKKPYDGKRPILGGTKIHVKRILHFSEKEEEEKKQKNSAESVYWSNSLLENMTITGHPSLGPQNSTLYTQLYTPELETNLSRLANNSNPDELYYVTFTNTTLIEVLLAVYSLIFLVGFILLLSFIVSKIIVIRKRRLK